MKVGTGAGTAVVALVEKGLVPGGTAGDMPDVNGLAPDGTAVGTKGGAVVRLVFSGFKAAAATVEFRFSVATPCSRPTCITKQIESLVIILTCASILFSKIIYVKSKRNITKIPTEYPTKQLS